MKRKTLLIREVAHKVLQKEAKRRKEKKDFRCTGLGDIASEYIIEYSELPK